MRNIVAVTIGAGLLFMTSGAFAQAPAPKTFDVASVKASEPLDMQRLAADVQNGKMPKLGMISNPGGVEFRYVALRELVAMAYKMKGYQVTGPDWLANQRFDIVAKYPKGATRDDMPEMLKNLLKERFKLEAHVENKEHPVTALVVAKGGPKMEESKEKPQAIDENAPLGEGESQQDSPDGPVRSKVDAKTGSGTVDMGAKGKIRFSMDQATMSLKFDAEQVSMSGLVEILGQFMQQMGGSSNKQLVDMTDLKGFYKLSLAIPMADLISMARAQGMDIPAGTEQALAQRTGQPVPAAGQAADPSGSGMLSSLSSAGLKLENRRAVVDQLVIDKMEKTPTEN